MTDITVKSVVFGDVETVTFPIAIKFILNPTDGAGGRSLHVKIIKTTDISVEFIDFGIANMNYRMKDTMQLHLYVTLAPLESEVGRVTCKSDRIRPILVFKP